MKDIKVKFGVSIPQERISDLLCNAFEGGSNYWYWIDEFNYPAGQTKESLGLKFPHIELPFIEGGSLTISDKEGDMPTKILDMKAIRKGLRIMSEKYPKHFADFLAENDDADTGDVFLQCCLYGDAIYG